MSETKPAREPGWYWVRQDPLCRRPDWVCAEWNGSAWKVDGWAAGDGGMAEIDDRRITRHVASRTAKMLVDVIRANLPTITLSPDEASERIAAAVAALAGELPHA